MIVAPERSSSAIQPVTGSSFARLVLGSPGPVAVEFMSYGCSHCRTIEPILERVAESIAREERVFRVNVALETELAREHGIEGTPTFVMFGAGHEVGRVEGPSPTLASVTAALTKPFRP